MATSSIIEIRVPDIGDFADVDVIEVLVAPGDRVGPEDSIVTIESDKASMEVPATQQGIVKDVHVTVGDKVSEGSIILTLETQDAEVAHAPDATHPPEAGEAAPPPRPQAVVARTDAADATAEVVVLGSGPGGYTAAFRAADLGKRTVLVERYPTLGGVCLNVGCIPSKALLHVAKLLDEVTYFDKHGVRFGTPEIDVEKLGQWKNGIVGRLTGGLTKLARQRKVQVLQGHGHFASPHTLEITTPDGTQTIAFEHAIVAAGSRSADLPGVPADDPRIMSSTDALALSEIPQRLLVIGGGIIGLELATVYHALGARVTVVELTDGLMPGCDRDLLRPLQRKIERQYESIYLRTRVLRIQAAKEGIRVAFEGEKAPGEDLFDRVLVAVGRRPNGLLIGAEAAGIHIDEMGFIRTDRQCRTNVPHIFAIGDIAGEPMLAHKASHEGKVAAEVIAGLKSSFDARAVPSVAYTDPEIAWAGVTEDDAKRDGLDYGRGLFPWAASGRSLAIGRDEGLTKILFDQASHRVIGAGIVGPSAGDLISELTLAIEMGSDAQDLGLTIHPHPTLSETISMAAEAFEGTITDLYVPKR